MGVGDQDIQNASSPFFLDTDLVTVAGGATFMGNLDIPEVVDMFAPVNVKTPEVSARMELQYATAAAPALPHNTLLTVKGVQYRVRSTRKTGDGQVSVAELALP